MIRNGPCPACSTWPARSGAGRCCTRRTTRARSSWPSTGTCCARRSRSRGPPADLPRRLAGKYSMFQLCRDLGVPTPQAMLAWSPGRPRAFAAAGRIPAHREAHHALAGTAGAAAEYHDRPTPSELQEICACAHETSTGLMLQEYIPPAPGQDWFFHGYFDAGRPLPARVHRGQGPLLPGLRRADQPGPVGAEQRLREQVTAMAATSASAGSWTSTCASTRGTPSTSCWTSTRASGPSSGCSPPTPGSTWPGPRTST